MHGERFADALRWAALKHARQTRKGTDIPYLTHLLAVAGMVGEQGADEDTAIAALLHDTIEDQGGDAARREIVAAFGPRVAALVDACTDTDTTPKPPWRARKEAHLERLADPAKTPAEAALIKTADAVHNLRTTLAELRKQGPAALDKFGGGRDGTLWRYARLAEVLGARRPGCPLAEELASLTRRLHEALAADNPPSGG